MSNIRFSCSNCGKSLSARSEWAGRKAHCKKCGQALTVPLADKVADESSTPSFRDTPTKPRETKPSGANAKRQQADQADSRPWYYTNDGTQCGPVPRSQLQQLFEIRKVGGNELVWTQGMAEWQPASSVPGLLPAATEPPHLPSPPPLVAHESRHSSPAPMGTSADFSTFAAELQMPLGWLRAGLLDGTRNFFVITGSLVAAWLIIAMSGVIPIIGPIVVTGPMMCGVWAMLLAVARHEKDSLSHMFDGFRVWGQAVVMHLVITVFGGFLLVVAIIVAIQIGQLAHSVAVPFLLLSPLLFYANVRLFMYVPALVVDRRMGVGEAIAYNWRLTSEKSFHLFLLLMFPYTLLLLLVAFSILGLIGWGAVPHGMGAILLYILICGLIGCTMGAVLLMPFVHAFNGRLHDLDRSPQSTKEPS